MRQADPTLIPGEGWNDVNAKPAKLFDGPICGLLGFAIGCFAGAVIMAAAIVAGGAS